MKQILIPIIILCLLAINGLGFDKKVKELQKQGEYSRAISAIDSILKTTTKKEEIIKLHKMASETWFRLDEFEKSLEAVNIAIKVAEPLNNDTIMAKLYNNKGIVYTLTKQWDSCLYYYNVSLDLKESLKDFTGVASNYNNIGMIYKVNGKMKKAIDMYHKSLKKTRQTTFKKRQYIALNNIGSAYKSINPDSSIHYYQKALQHAQNEKELFEQRKIVSNLSHQFEALKKYKQAAIYLKEFNNLNDKIFNIEQEKQLADFQLQQEIDQKQHTIELQTTKLENRKEVIIIVSLSAVLLLITLIFVFYYYSENQKTKDKFIALKQESIKNYLLGQEKDRQIVARQLHDDLNGSLTGARFTDKKDKQEFFVRKAQGQLDDAIESLYSDALDKAGLKMAMLQFQDLMRNHGMEINFSPSPDLPRFEKWFEISVYRLVTSLIKIAHQNGIIDMHTGLYFEHDTGEFEILLIIHGKELKYSHFNDIVKALIVILEAELSIKDEVITIVKELKPLKTTKNEMANS